MVDNWIDRSGGPRERVTVAVSAWLLVAVFVDGWAHFNRPGLETFFTPWHAGLYSGLGAVGAWVALLMWRRWQNGHRALDVIPPGYGATIAGIGVFSVGGLLDMLWHQAFGIEVAVDALVSPTHLLLAFGGILILSTGLRTARGDRGQEWTIPAVTSLVLVTALAAFFLIYVSAFAGDAPTIAFTPTPETTPGHEAAELPVVASLGSYLVTTVLLVVPLLFLLRGETRPPRGALTLLVGSVAVLTAGVVGFPAAQLAGAVGAMFGALIADLILASRIAAPPTARTSPYVLGGIIALVWTGQLIGLAIMKGLHWPVSLWVGVVVLSAALATAVAMPRGDSGIRTAVPTRGLASAQR